MVFTGSLPSLLTIIGLIIYQIIDILIDIRKYLKFWLFIQLLISLELTWDYASEIRISFLPH